VIGGADKGINDGNAGREFDLTTDQRVAEFRAIEWQGGPERIRQNSLFCDFDILTEQDSNQTPGHPDPVDFQMPRELSLA
jgi:hypothetical protein